MGRLLNAVGVRISEPAADLAVMLAITFQPARTCAAARLFAFGEGRPGFRQVRQRRVPGSDLEGGGRWLSVVGIKANAPKSPSRV